MLFGSGRGCLGREFNRKLWVRVLDMNLIEDELLRWLISKMDF